jgi:hypothetical protein
MCKEIVHSVHPILSKAVKDVVNVSTRKSNMLDEQSGSLIFTSPGNINIKEFTQGPDSKFLLIATGSNRNASDVDAGSSISNPIPNLTVSNIGEGSVKGEHLILPIPGEDVMNASNSIGIPDMDSLVASMKALPLPSVDSLPCNYDLLDSLNPPNASSNYMFDVAHRLYISLMTSFRKYLMKLEIGG